VSFILDALRKSEHERQRSAVPGLSHVPLATARREMPGWALIVIGVLAAAVLVLAGAWWQSQRSLNASAASSAAPAPAQAASNPPPIAPPALAAPAPAPAASAPVAAVPPPAPVAPAPVAAVPPPATAPTTVAAAAPPPAVIAPASPRDAEPIAPLAEKSQSLADAIPKQQPAPTGPTLPSVAALLAQGVDVPPLKLELHAYSDTPAERFVFINGRKYKEGERLADGPEVVRIEPNGVVLSQHGQRFQLAPE
jgi:general secretion pathway protein B